MRESTSEMAVLGALALGGEMSGYDIRQFIDASISHFWRESYGQIYPVLAQLGRQKLVKSSADKASNRDRRRYSITKAGRQRLVEWLVIEPQPERPRNELLLKVFLASQAPTRIVIQHLESMIASCRAQTKELKQVEQEVRLQDAGSETLRFSIATIRAGIRMAQARARWAREAIEIISKRQA